MNTSGIQRGYMAKNMKAEEFIKVVVNALSMEFEKEVKLEIINDNEFRITFDNYKIKMSKENIEKHKTPYGLDRYILESLRKNDRVHCCNNGCKRQCSHDWRFR